LFEVKFAQKHKVIDVLLINDYDFLQKDKKLQLDAILNIITKLLSYKIHKYQHQPFGFQISETKNFHLLIALKIAK
jgi:hypothetical protein